MKIVVLLKQVARLRDDATWCSETRWIDEAEAKLETNPYDLFALESALRLRERGEGGEVAVITLGPASAREALRGALEIGADRAVHITDAEVEHSDPLAVAGVLARACRRERPDLILAGFMSEDRQAAAVGPMVAELLDVPSATGIVSIEAVDRGFLVERELENGAYETVELDGPCLATVQTGIAEVRYPSLKAIVAARKKSIDELDAASLQQKPGASRVVVEALDAPAGGGASIEGSVDKIVSVLLDKLAELRVV